MKKSKSLSLRETADTTKRVSAPPAFLLPGCNGPSSPPSTGVRMRAGILESPFLAAGSGPPVGNAFDSGSEQAGSYGGGSPTSVTSFDGTTNGFGIDDHPEAQTNALWTVTWDFTQTIAPACGAKTFVNNKLFNPPAVNVDYGDCVIGTGIL